MLRFHFKGPLTYLPVPAPLIAEVAVFVMVSKFAPVVIRRPDVKVSIPETDTAPLKDTPALLLTVKLLAPVTPLPVT